MASTLSISQFLNTLTKLKLVYKRCSTYYTSLLLTDNYTHNLKIMSTNPERCNIEIDDHKQEGDVEVLGYLNTFSVNTYITDPFTHIVMWRLRLVINDRTYIVAMDSEPIFG
jgi:hypothetical protein